MDKFIEKIKEKLIEEKALVEKELKNIAKPNEDNDWSANFPQFDSNNISSGNLEEATDEVEEFSSLVPISESLEKRLKEINIALEKIKKGNFGICEKCGAKIPKKRLLIYPSANLCRKCQK
jgi:DnaK suppressor protein